MKKSAAAENFVPFEPIAPGPPSDGAPRLKVMPKAASPESSGEFAPLQGPSTPSPTPAHTGHTPQASSTPTVTLQREGDRITHIRIECSCGQVIELACSY